MPTLFVTATGTNVGKTYAMIQLIKAFANAGLRVGVFKPIETGVEDVPEDARLLLQACQQHNPDFSDLSPVDITAYTFALPAAPFCADIDQTVSIEKIMDKQSELSKRCDLLLVEGAGGLMVPITKEVMMIDLIDRMKGQALLVTPSRLGCINETLLSIEALQSRGVAFDWCVNLHEEREHFSAVTQPFYDAVLPGWWTLQNGLESFVEKLVNS